MSDEPEIVGGGLRKRPFKPRKRKMKPRHPDRMIGYRWFGHKHKIVAILFYFGFGVAAICRITGFKEHLIKKCSHARETFEYMSEIEQRVVDTVGKGDLVGLLRKNCEDAIKVLGEIQNDVKVDPKERMAAAEKNLKHYKDLLALRGQPSGLGDNNVSLLAESLTRFRGVLDAGKTEPKMLEAGVDVNVPDNADKPLENNT